MGTKASKHVHKVLMTVILETTAHTGPRCLGPLDRGIVVCSCLYMLKQFSSVVEDKRESLLRNKKMKHILKGSDDGV
jgi:hypothetical protein